MINYLEGISFYLVRKYRSKNGQCYHQLDVIIRPYEKFECERLRRAIALSINTDYYRIFRLIFFSIFLYWFLLTVDGLNAWRYMHIVVKVLDESKKQNMCSNFKRTILTIPSSTVQRHSSWEGGILRAVKSIPKSHALFEVNYSQNYLI